jgi:hypothetical protein
MMKNVSSDDVKRADSAGTTFKKSLNELIASLSKCRPSYVRCLKPNETKTALKSEEERFRHQIRFFKNKKKKIVLSCLCLISKKIFGFAGKYSRAKGWFLQPSNLRRVSAEIQDDGAARKGVVLAGVEGVGERGVHGDHQTFQVDRRNVSIGKNKSIYSKTK